MKNFLLYILTVLIWGSTWLAIEFQLGEVAVEVSVFYRFAIAALIMWAYCLMRGVSMTFGARDHLFIVLLAFGNFSVNYMFMYWAQEDLTSAMTSIAFSTMLLMNIVNTRLCFGVQIEKRTYAGAFLGVAGIIALFWDDLSGSNLADASLRGLALVLTGTLIASYGNMASVRNSKHGLNIFAVNAWGMLYGSIVLVLFALFNGAEFTFSTRPSYIASLLYLSVFGTVIAFASYFVLLKNLGAAKASYAVVLFPVIAVCLSSIFEEFIWTDNVIIGFVMVLLGNFIVLTPVDKLVKFTNRKPTQTN
jgi:drug/metabolite transporter (DMT)-like permease